MLVWSDLFAGSGKSLTMLVKIRKSKDKGEYNSGQVAGSIKKIKYYFNRTSYHNLLNVNFS